MTNALAFSAYYELAKPRMVYANVVVAAAAFYYASHGSIEWLTLAATLAGLGLVIASGCVFNNYYDRDIDAAMERTKCRAMPTGSVPRGNALVWGTVLLSIGMALLGFVNMQALLVAVVGWVVYVLLYTPLKHRSPSALFVGAVAGATPPVVGYAAAYGALDMVALYLFVLLFVWQLPHFIAISIYRGEEYASAGVPMYIRGPFSAGQKKLARRVFHASLVVLLSGCATLVALA